MKTKYPIVRFVDTLDDLSTTQVKIADGIRKTVEDFVERYIYFEDAKATQKPRTDKWSRKEILGHLIDSAANNHQRFVRVQYLKDTNFPSYDQEKWVNIQKYGLRTWKELLLLWKSYNIHLAHIIDTMPAEYLQIPCTIGSSEPLTVGYVVVDYLGHMQHHIIQLEQM
jgi:hypothetical protein